MNRRNLSVQRCPFLSIVVLCVAAGGAPPTRTQSAPTRPDLSGAVGRADGTPVPGAAVYIYTAGPRRGYSPY